MPKLNLGYGKTHLKFDFDKNRFQILGEEKNLKPLTDVEINEKLDSPIDSPPVEEIIKPDETVLIVVPDATRRSASGQIVNLLVRRLIANGTNPFDISIIFATGIHRKVTEEEKQEILTPFIAQRIKTLDHNAKDLMQSAGLESKQFVNLGKTKNGTPIELNRALVEHDHIITIGAISFHYFAGFTGGRKLICPGLASSRTISETHRLAFDCEKKARREGVGSGLLEGNAVHEAFMEVAEKMPPTFSINTFVNDRGAAVDLVCGDWKLAHRKACEIYASQYTLKIEKKRDLVVVSCGGFPFDLNMIQAHKALEAASHACTPGGTIIFLAECANGPGRDDFLDWFKAGNSEALAENLCKNYQVNGQTAWSLLSKAERFNIQIITNLSKEETSQMHLQKTRSLKDAFSKIGENAKGYILPFGAKFLIK